MKHIAVITMMVVTLTTAVNGEAASPSMTEVYQPQSDQLWTRQFNDPILDELVEIALSNSPTLDGLKGNMLSARGVRAKTNAALLPEIALAASRQDTDLLGQERIPYTKAGAELSYEVDLFGKNGESAAAGQQRYKASKYEFSAGKIMLVSDIASTYTRLRSYEALLELTQENVRIANKAFDIISAQFSIGETTQLDVETADHLRHSFFAQVPVIEAEIERNRLALAKLSGKEAEQLQALLDQESRIPSLNRLPLLGEPLRRIEERPDIAAQKARLLAAKNDHESAKREWLPAITVNGFYGSTEGETSPGQSFDSSEAWSSTIAARFDLLDFGRNGGEEEGRRGAAQRAEAAYNNAVLSALTEIEAAMINVQTAKQELRFIRKGKKNATMAFNLSYNLYNEGELALLEILDVKLTAIRADEDLVRAQNKHSQSVISLYRVFGVL